MTAADFVRHDWIAGRWVEAHDAKTLVVRDPANDAVLAEVPSVGSAETRQAIAAASEALAAWRRRPAGERSVLLRALHDAMIDERDRLAWVLTRENGKPLAEAKAEITYAAGFIEWAAEEAKRVYGETVPSSFADKRILVLRQPIGVTAAITPWNFPAAMITRKLGPALAVGCTMVIKPASQTPLTALALAKLTERIGFPPGVINVITGAPSPIAGEMLEHPDVRMLSFTGSTEVGQRLMRLAAHNVTKLGLELGGHAPFLVFDDADVAAAVRGAMASKFRAGGQTCVCANRFYVQRGIYDAFVQALEVAMQALRVGPGLTQAVDIGPLIDDAGIRKVEAHVADALEHGARLRLGGERIQIHDASDRFYAPTLLEDVRAEMLVMREETFGPVVPVCRFDDEHQAITWANDTPYGLAAYAYTRDLARAVRVAEALEYGVVGINDGLPSTPQAPFGGMKRSGIGREGGKYALEEFLETKYVSLGLG